MGLTPVVRPTWFLHLEEGELTSIGTLSLLGCPEGGFAGEEEGFAREEGYGEAGGAGMLE